MYNGSELFSYKDKDERYEVKGYWYRGDFYRQLQKAIMALENYMHAETDIYDKSVKELFRELNEFETAFLTIDYLAYNNSYVEVYAFLYKDKSLSEEEKLDLKRHFYKNAFKIDYDEKMKKIQEIIKEQRDKIIQFYKSKPKAPKNNDMHVDDEVLDKLFGVDKYEFQSDIDNKVNQYNVANEDKKMLDAIKKNIKGPKYELRNRDVQKKLDEKKKIEIPKKIETPKQIEQPKKIVTNKFNDVAKKIVVPVKKNDSPKIELRNRTVKKFVPSTPKYISPQNKKTEVNKKITNLKKPASKMTVHFDTSKIPLSKMVFPLGLIESDFKYGMTLREGIFKNATKRFLVSYENLIKNFTDNSKKYRTKSMVSYKFPDEDYRKFLTELNTCIATLETTYYDKRVSKDVALRHFKLLKTRVIDFFRTRENAYEIRYFNNQGEEIKKEDFLKIKDSEVSSESSDAKNKFIQIIKGKNEQMDFESDEQSKEEEPKPKKYIIKGKDEQMDFDDETEDQPSQDGE